jgi:fumarate hydratase class II
MSDHRIERDSLGDVKVPADALYGAQTQRAVDNFRLSSYRFPRPFIYALASIKRAAAIANTACDTLPSGRADAIVDACDEIIGGDWNREFVVDIFQTGSGTSMNMNMNEVIANRCAQLVPDLDPAIHPNDDVNRSQSSNDVIPTAVRIAAMSVLREDLLPSLAALGNRLSEASARIGEAVKPGRTHLMDAMPVTYGQVLTSWCERVAQGHVGLEACLNQLAVVPLGGTAVGTGVNTPPDFARRVVDTLARAMDLPLEPAPHPMAHQAGSESLLATSAAMRQTASTLLRLADDIRWLASGPLFGFGEIRLDPKQPGSSIMPAKVNPVIEEAVIQACLQVQAPDHAVNSACLFGSFELHVMQPLIAYNLLEGLRLLAAACRHLADASIADIAVDAEALRKRLDGHPVLVTALAPTIGYDQAATIAKQALAEGKPIREVAERETDIDPAELQRLLDPRRLTGA